MATVGEITKPLLGLAEEAFADTLAGHPKLYYERVWPEQSVTNRPFVILADIAFSPNLGRNVVCRASFESWQDGIGIGLTVYNENIGRVDEAEAGVVVLAEDCLCVGYRALQAWREEFGLTKV
jgi:hypothetical protein